MQRAMDIDGLTHARTHTHTHTMPSQTNTYTHNALPNHTHTHRCDPLRVLLYTDGLARFW